MKIYSEKVCWDLYYKYKFKNIMQVPYIIKVIINSSFGKFFLDKKKVDSFYNDLYNISYQKPLFVKSKKSLSEFKLKKGEKIAFKITLRKNNMYNFLYKFLIISIPLIKNFEGLSLKSFDIYGNYNMGINDYSIFPESENFDFFDFTVGLNISIIFKLSDPSKSLFLLKYLNFPFKNA